MVVRPVVVGDVVVVVVLAVVVVVATVVVVLVVVVVVVLVVELDAPAGGSVAPYFTAPSPRMRPESCVL